MRRLCPPVIGLAVAALLAIAAPAASAAVRCCFRISVDVSGQATHRYADATYPDLGSETVSIDWSARGLYQYVQQARRPVIAPLHNGTAPFRFTARRKYTTLEDRGDGQLVTQSCATTHSAGWQRNRGNLFSSGRTLEADLDPDKPPLRRIGGEPCVGSSASSLSAHSGDLDDRYPADPYNATLALMRGRMAKLRRGKSFSAVQRIPLDHPKDSRDLSHSTEGTIALRWSVRHFPDRLLRSELRKLRALR